MRWAIAHLPGEHALSSSFGAQAAVSLHLVTRFLPSIPVVLVDTGYLFPETYRFVDDLVVRLGLNLKVYQSRVSPAWLEARHGRLWEQGIEGIERYNELRKTEPMQRALRNSASVRGSPVCVATRLRAVATSGRSSGATAAGSYTRFSTGTTGRCSTTCANTSFRTTRSGRRATCRSATGTPRARSPKPATPRRRGSSA